MRPLICAHLTIVALAIAAAGCDAVGNYRGDGKLIDNGPTAATYRYVLVLGPAHLGTTGKFSYRIENLPFKDFTLGIHLTRPPTAAKSMSDRPIQAVVAVELRAQDDAIVFQREGSLSDWTWSIPSTGEWAFVYGRDAPNTHFMPKRGAMNLTFTVLKPDPAGIAYAPMIMAKSGGWK